VKFPHRFFAGDVIVRLGQSEIEAARRDARTPLAARHGDVIVVDQSASAAAQRSAGVFRGAASTGKMAAAGASAADEQRTGAQYAACLSKPKSNGDSNGRIHSRGQKTHHVICRHIR